MNMRFVFLSVVCFALSCMAQLQTPVRFSVQQKKVSDNTLEVEFIGKAEAGWHVYGTDIADGGPTRAELTLEKAVGLKPEGKLSATGVLHRAMDELFNMEVSYMEGTAKFVQKFTITEPKYEVAGYLTYGACNDQNCMPPTDVEFNFEGTGTPQADNAAVEKEKAEEKVAEEITVSLDSGVIDAVFADTLLADTAAVSAEFSGDLWTPVIDELKAFEDGSDTKSNSLLGIFLLGMLGGLVALLTPCVWPIIPMTVSFFLKRNKERSKAIREAFTYGLSIIVIYVFLGLLVTLLFGANALNAMSTNAWFNIFFALLLIVFAASFFGAFELTLPSSWSNKIDQKSESTTGLLSIFLMAFTLVLVSFSCTGPIIGFLLVAVSTQGSILGPTLGMLGFSIGLAIPFAIFALFPSLLKSAPKSGGWMNTIKVVLGFIELAFALKFLSVADLAYGWRLLDREVFLSLWIALFGLMGAYLMGWIRFPHDDAEHRTNVPQFFLGLISFAFTIYMIPGLWGAPLKAISAFTPPMYTQDYKIIQTTVVEAKFKDFERGMAYAKEQGKPVIIDFTGFGCVNCRKMEAAVWTDQEVARRLNDDYVLISLYVDDKTPLAEPMEVEVAGQKRTLRTVGDKWSHLQATKFGANTQPFYVLLDTDGKPIAPSRSYNEDIQEYIDWLDQGLSNLKQ